MNIPVRRTFPTASTLLLSPPLLACLALAGCGSKSSADSKSGGGAPPPGGRKVPVEASPGRIPNSSNIRRNIA